MNTTDRAKVRRIDTTDQVEFPAHPTSVCINTRISRFFTCSSYLARPLQIRCLQGHSEASPCVSGIHLARFLMSHSQPFARDFESLGLSSQCTQPGNFCLGSSDTVAGRKTKVSGELARLWFGLISYSRMGHRLDGMFLSKNLRLRKTPNAFERICVLSIGGRGSFYDE